MPQMPEALVLLAVLLALPGPSSCQQMPQFAFTPTTKILFGWDDTWEAGYPDSLAILSSGMKIILRVRLAGDLGGGLTRILSYRCASKSAAEQLDLDSISATASVERCSGDIAFSVKKGASPDEFHLTMGDSQVSCRNALNQSVTLSVLIQYSGGDLQSKSLSLWNLDPVNSFPSPSPKQSFLTQRAVNFLTGGEFGVDNLSDPMPSLQFIEPDMISILKSAPAFFWPKMNLGALLNFDPSGCTYFQYERSTLFVNYDSKFDMRHVLLQKVVHLDLNTGLLWYSKCRLTSMIYSFYQTKRPSEISICLVTSFSGSMQPYFKVTEVKVRMTTPADYSFADCTSSVRKVCGIVPVTPNVTVFLGMDYTPLVCPIVCDDSNEVYSFYYNGQQLIPPKASDWDTVDLPNGALGLRIAKSGNMIEIPPTSMSFAGAYRCEATSKSFTFNVRIVAMPSFSPTVAGYTLPARVFAMEGEALTFGCSAGFSGLTSVKLDAAFYFPEAGTPVRWSELSWASLNDRFGAASTVNISSVNTAQAKSLSINVRKVPGTSGASNFTHRVMCRASVPATDSAVGVATSFSAQTGSDILHIARPSRESFLLSDANSCSVQRCYLFGGATFNFSLSPNYAAYLRKINVDVVAYLRIDDLLLTDVSVLIRANVSQVTVGDEASMYSLSYRIWPIGTGSSDARRELEKRSGLTPVYNFRYKSASDMGNLRLAKDKYGESSAPLRELDCRADPLCFYSTDFDVPGDLRFLTVRLTFAQSSVQTAEAGFSYLIGIIVACIAVILGLVVLLIYLVHRSPVKTYKVEEKEIQQGHDPVAEARNEKFKEYQRADGPQDQRRTSFANAGYSGSVGHMTVIARQGTSEEEL